MRVKQKKQTKVTKKTRPTLVLKRREKILETDSAYFLKLVVFLLLGTLWLKFQQPMVIAGIPLNGIPLGLFVGLILVRQFEKFQSDRKIWYATLLVVTVICYFVPAGIIL